MLVTLTLVSMVTVQIWYLTTNVTVSPDTETKTALVSQIFIKGFINCGGSGGGVQKGRGMNDFVQWYLFIYLFFRELRSLLNIFTFVGYLF